MPYHHIASTNDKLCKISLYISILIILIYSNTFSASWHLDDYSNIINNSNLHITSITPETIYNSTHANPTGGTQLYRPVACLSFALNWYFTKEQLWGFHLTNIFIHAITAIVLFITILKLLSTPAVVETSEEKKIFIAALTAVLWSSHPIQTQAVTYIVQRMASLAALFSLLSILYYLKGRMVFSNKHRIAYWIFAFLFFAFAIGSKENALVLPLSFFLIEYIFFKTFQKNYHNKIFSYIFLCALFGIISIVGYHLLTGNWPSISYEGKTFTLVERSLTEPRIVLYYLSQFFYPLPERFSITHDITISTSFFHPWTTIPSILFILFLVVFCIRYIEKFPLLSFAILFFFLNHLVESSIFPLELIFEHRNYLPSLFLFLPCAYGLAYLIYEKYNNNLAIKIALSCFICIIIITLGLGTINRNMIWASEKTLWTDAMNKAPASARPYDNLAWGYYARAGDYPTAITLYNRALTLWDANKHHRALMHNNLGGIYFQIGQYDKAIYHWKKSIQIVDKFWKPHYGICQAYIKQGNWNNALKEATNSLENGLVSSDLVFASGLVYLRLKQPKMALSTFSKLTHNTNLSEKSSVGMGLSFLMMKDYPTAISSFTSVITSNPKDIEALLGLIAAETNLGNTKNATVFVDKILMVFPDHEIMEALNQIFYDNTALPFPQSEILPVIKKRIIDRAHQLINTINYDFGT